MSIIEINAGLGDLFITRLFLDNNKTITNNLCINIKTIQEYRTLDKEYLFFLLYLLKQVFSDRKVYLDKGNISNKKNIDINIIQGIVKDLKIYFPFISTKKYQEKYIVIHTKVRIDGKGLDYMNLNKFANLMIEFKTNHKIFLIGERKISDVLEKDVHKIQSIYEYLIPMKNNNDVIDLTQDELILKPDIKNFERDLQLIHHADMNIGIGWGGNFSMTWAVSDNFCFFIDFLKHPLFDFFKKMEKGFLYNDFNKFLEKIKSF